MAVKYVKDFDFPSSAGFHSGAKGYAKGGAVKAPTRTKSTMKREMTQSNKLSGNGALPRISDMDVNKQSGGAGKKLMPGYKAGGPIKAAKGYFVTKGDKIAAEVEESKPLNRFKKFVKESNPLSRVKKFAENTSAEVLEGLKSKIQKPVLKAVANAGPRIAKTLSKIPNKKATALATLAAGAGTAAASLMGDDDEADMEMEDIPVKAIRRTESLSAPMKKAASKSVSAMDAVLAYNKLHNKDFDDDMERQIRDRFASPSEGGMKSGGKVSKYAGGGMGPMSSAEDRMKAKRSIDPYEDRTRGFGAMTDAEAEAASKELRQKYGKKEDRPVMHPGGRQRFLLNQTEKAPMKRGGKAEASKSDMQQDRALMARHNRLMHPDQKSKMKNGGKSVPSYSSKPLIKKSGGGSYNY